MYQLHDLGKIEKDTLYTTIYKNNIGAPNRLYNIFWLFNIMNIIAKRNFFTCPNFSIGKVVTSLHFWHRFCMLVYIFFFVLLHIYLLIALPTKIFKFQVKYLYSRLKWKIHSALAYTNIIQLGNRRLIII